MSQPGGRARALSRGAYHQPMPTFDGSGPDPCRPGRRHADDRMARRPRDHLSARRTLRWLCPCAYCRGEAGLPGWLDSAPTLTPDQTRLVDIALVGQYAVAPTWGDGHHTGFYTFTALREMCPCAECTGKRIGRPASPPWRGQPRRVTSRPRPTRPRPDPGGSK